ncbi:MAG: hypothetical protein L6Q37_10325, partial [Bdellovibrionaceae bacterium]|nr:hypothetical protein [Pseudobdellovibrionaceae bacterium]
CHFQVGSLPIEKNDKILLLNCELISPNLWSQYSKIDSLDDIFKNQIKFNSNESFWGSVIEFES